MTELPKLSAQIVACTDEELSAFIGQVHDFKLKLNTLELITFNAQAELSYRAILAERYVVCPGVVVPDAYYMLNPRSSYSTLEAACKTAKKSVRFNSQYDGRPQAFTVLKIDKTGAKVVAVIEPTEEDKENAKRVREAREQEDSEKEKLTKENTALKEKLEELTKRVRDLQTDLHAFISTPW